MARASQKQNRLEASGKKGSTVRSFEAERLKARADKRQKRKAKEAQDIEVQQIPVVPTLYVKRVVEPANQELASTDTPEPIHNNTDIIEIDESITICHRAHAFIN